MISECGKSKTPVPDGTPTVYSLKAAINFSLSTNGILILDFL